MLFNFFKRKNYYQLSNEQLLDAYREENDSEALGVLYERNLEMVFATCARYLDDEAAAKDAALDIYEQLCEKVRLHDIQNFESWLYILAKNHCLMILRRKKTTTTMPIDDYNHIAAQEEISADEHSAQQTELNDLQSCINRLPDDQKQAITLFYLEEKSYKEISDIMNEDITKVRSYIQNGRRNLKICMGAKDTDE